MALSVQERDRVWRPPVVGNEAATYVENNIILSGQQQPPIFSLPLNQFVPEEEERRQQEISKVLFREADDEVKKLLSSIEQVQLKIQKKSKGKYVAQDLKICSWNDVMTEVETTSQQWNTLPGKASGRKCLEVLGERSEAFQSWIGLLPAGDYGSSICGVFKLAVGAASRYVEVEDAIFDALTQFPELMESARKYVEIYRTTQDHRLTHKTFDLYLAILKALNHIMQFFLESKSKKIIDPFIKQSSYKMHLTNSLKEVEKHTQRIKDEAAQCMAMRQAKMDQEALLLGKSVGDLHEKIDNLPLMWQTMYQNLYRLMASNPMNNQSYQSYGAETIDTLSPMRYITAGSSSPLSSRSVISLNTQTSMDMKISSQMISKLLLHLHFDPDVIKNDMKTTIRLGYTLSSTEASRAAQLICAPPFKDWFASISSSSLLVNGNVDLEAAEGPSPFSLADVQLITVLQDNNEIYVVHWFADLHRQSQTDDAKGRTVDVNLEMMASLVGQLASQLQERSIPINLDFLTKHDWHQLAKFSLKSLTTVFRELVDQIPSPSPLVIVIDEISIYETLALEVDTQTIVRRLQRLVQSSHTVVKLLITCRARSISVGEIFSNEETLDLDAEIEGDDAAFWKISNIANVDG